MKEHFLLISVPKCPLHIVISVTIVDGGGRIIEILL